MATLRSALPDPDIEATLVKMAQRKQELLAQLPGALLDLTGGAPELNPRFRELVKGARRGGHTVQVRTNLAVLGVPGMEELPLFFRAHEVHLVASLPCYLEENVNSQRGDGVFGKSIDALRQLNQLGYGKNDSGLQLNLVYNPQGPSLPPPQVTLEQDYKKHLLEQFGIVFNRLLTITNMPIQRFGSTLVSKGQFGEYMDLLKSS